ncbi:two-component response regulator [Tsuneonella dongtanensis]|uniref:Two-component response regulator n=1 Tax=Tsuneonella dongtanensis TaxID=692370 RepID=A0A1B2ADQ5_9SPHN|nr:response regulator [Tsuneonella dongtanensis]ANY20273.1 two-component response regulator [Tsuneonella dongtanensis]
MRAIIVEDEFLAAIHAESVLERCGVQVIGTAEDMEGALALSDERPNLALVDLNLRDGFTGPAIGSSLARTGVEIVFVTANPSQLEGCNEFASPVIEKPIDEQLLVDTVERIKRQAKPTSQAY